MFIEGETLYLLSVSIVIVFRQDPMLIVFLSFLISVDVLTYLESSLAVWYVLWNLLVVSTEVGG